jgi:hypothetical protein
MLANAVSDPRERYEQANKIRVFSTNDDRAVHRQERPWAVDVRTSSAVAACVFIFYYTDFAARFSPASILRTDDACPASFVKRT